MADPFLTGVLKAGGAVGGGLARAGAAVRRGVENVATLGERDNPGSLRSYLGAQASGLNPTSSAGALNLAATLSGGRMGEGLMPEDLSYSRLPPEPPLQRLSGEAPPPRPSGRGSTMTVKEAQKRLDAAVADHTDLFARVDAMKHEAGMYNKWGNTPEVDFSASDALLHQARMRETAARDDLRSAKVAQTKLLASPGKPVFPIPSKPYTKSTPTVPKVEAAPVYTIEKQTRFHGGGQTVFGNRTSAGEITDGWMLKKDGKPMMSYRTKRAAVAAKAKREGTK